ncbi:hypothetical protein V6Z12_D06G246700 [Gossypium hirsutum]
MVCVKPLQFSEKKLVHLTITPPKPKDSYNNGGQYFITNLPLGYQIFKNYLRLHKMLVLDIDIFLLPQIFIPIPLSNHLLKLIKCAPHILLHLVQEQSRGMGEPFL